MAPHKAIDVSTSTDEELQASYDAKWKAYCENIKSARSKLRKLKARRRAPVPAFTLQELLDPPAHIPQADLAEYLRAVDDLETLGSFIAERLILGQPVQNGDFSARIATDGRLRVEQRRR